MIFRRTFSSHRFFSSLAPTIRVRFAPSPTGSVHLGGLRSALYNYIFARQHKGKFVLRIEDTDLTRLVPGSIQEIEKVLDWAGIAPDESPSYGGDFGPYLQSKRLDLYRHYAQELLDSGKAYKCFCSPDRLELLRKYQARNREKPRYDGKCSHLTPAEVDQKMSETQNKYVIRFALKPGRVVFNDHIFGPIATEFVENMESDPVIIKTDQNPTYHFANVVDDHLMEISHVLRGSEWINSTAKHIQIYRAFDWQQPEFFHFPLITMEDGTKMSKRNNRSQLKTLIESGFRPLTIINFITSIGGGLSHEKQNSLEVWDLERIIKEFDFRKITSHPGSADIDRLNIYGRNEISKMCAEDRPAVLREFKDLLIKNRIQTDLSDDRLSEIICQFAGRIVTLNDLLSTDNVYIWECPRLSWSKEEYHEEGWNLESIAEDVIQVVDSSNLEDKEALIDKLKSTALKHQVNWTKLMRLMRKLLTNSDKGLPVHEILTTLGKDRALDYLRKGLDYVK